jgi:hypothetical protein
MSWSTIRKATDDDKQRLNDAEVAFCVRHGINYADIGAWLAIDCVLNPGSCCSSYDLRRARQLAPLWRRIVHRALRCRADGIAYGYVGNHAE